MCSEQSINREIEIIRSEIETHKFLLAKKQERLEELEDLAQVYTRRRRYERVRGFDDELPRRKKSSILQRKGIASFLT